MKRNREAGEGVASAFFGNPGGTDFWPRGGALCRSFPDWCGGHRPDWVALDSAQWGALAPPQSDRLWGRCARRDRMIRTALFLGAGLALAGAAGFGQRTVAERGGRPRPLH